MPATSAARAASTSVLSGQKCPRVDIEGAINRIVGEPRRIAFEVADERVGLANLPREAARIDGAAMFVVPQAVCVFHRAGIGAAQRQVRKRACALHGIAEHSRELPTNRCQRTGEPCAQGRFDALRPCRA